MVQRSLQATEPTLPVRIVAGRLAVSESLVYELCKRGVIRHSRHGLPGKRGTIRISEDALAEYLALAVREGVAPLPLRHINLRPS
jgi:hypothetical protein